MWTIGSVKSIRWQPCDSIKEFAARSAQQLVTQALDAWLAGMPELDAMAERAPDRAAQAAQKD